jgi:exoribonuclease-2
LLADGLYFRGTPTAVTVCTAAEVEQEQQARAAKIAEKEAWETFLGRVATGQLEPDDSRYLTEVEQLALRRQDKSRVLRELGLSESAERAHALLLQLGYWNYTHNPYPQRLGLDTSISTAWLPGTLPDEPRLDLTHLPAFAIDDEGSTDPDDALSLEGNRLWVHVADVAALIPPASPADNEALGRGANLYLPDTIVHMLPKRATQILALGLAEISPALSFGLDLGEDGEIMGVEIKPSWVRVERLSYEVAETRLAEAPFNQLYALAQQYKARRKAQGAIELELPEVKVRWQGEKVVIRPILPLKSRDIVREAMLMAGEAIARFALQANIPFPFTSQDPPDLSDLPLPEDLAGMFAQRLLMKPGQVKSVPTPHTGLGLELYTRVTSPLRRYLDLVAHQQLRAYLRGDPLLDEQTLLARVGAAEAVSGSVRRAERLSNRHWTLVYFLQNPAWVGQAVVIEQRGRNTILLIPELDFETRLPLRGNPLPNSLVSLALQSVNLPALEARFQVQRDAQ